jgi:ParB/RepB/Spo0J family partition protein
MNELQQVPTRDLKPAPFNPRTFFDDEKMSNLVESVKAGGIHEPIIGRKVNGHIEIVAGERRWRAAQKAKLETVPIILRELTDAEALEIQIIENEQREDVSALDQAAGFRKLMELDPKTYTAETLAQRIGLKPASVYLRLKLLAMNDGAKALFREGKIDAGHAVLIARLSVHDQDKAVKWLRDELKHRGEEGQVGVRDLKRWINQNVKVDLFGPELAETQPQVATRLAKLKDKGVEVAQITRQYMQPEEAKKAGLLQYNDYREIGKKKCDHARIGAVVLGADKVELLDICTEKKCKTHWPEVAAANRARTAHTRQAKESPAAKAKRLKAEADQKRQREIENALRGKVLTQILGGVKAIGKPVLAYLVNSQLDMAGGVEFEDELKALGLDKLYHGTTRDGSHLLKATDRQLAQLAILGVIGDRLHYELPKVAKEFRVDLKKLAKGLQTAAPQGAEQGDLKGIKKQIDRQAAKRSKAGKKR